MSQPLSKSKWMKLLPLSNLRPLKEKDVELPIKDRSLTIELKSSNLRGRRCLELLNSTTRDALCLE